MARYDGPGHSYDLAYAVEASPNGARVFVTGESRGLDGEYDYGTIAYDATDGSQLWVGRYDAGLDDASAIAVSPDGTAVFVTGNSYAGARSPTSPRSPTMPPPAPIAGPADTTGPRAGTTKRSRSA